MLGLVDLLADVTAETLQAGQDGEVGVSDGGQCDHHRSRCHDRGTRTLDGVDTLACRLTIFGLASLVATTRLLGHIRFERRDRRHGESEAMFHINKAIAVTAAALAASVLPLVAASPAQATAEQCVEFLEEYGFEPHQTTVGCLMAADNQEVGKLMLMNDGVPEELADEAARLAQQQE
jgi:hypothetical protein